MKPIYKQNEISIILVLLHHKRRQRIHIVMSKLSSQNLLTPTQEENGIWKISEKNLLLGIGLAR